MYLVCNLHIFLYIVNNIIQHGYITRDYICMCNYIFTLIIFGNKTFYNCLRGLLFSFSCRQPENKCAYLQVVSRVIGATVKIPFKGHFFKILN